MSKKNGRKRYRPLDAIEERSVGVEHILQLGSLFDEQSYCFSWPESPLSSMLRCSNALLSSGVHSNAASTGQPVSQPPIAPINSIVAEHGDVDFLNFFSFDKPLISFASTNASLAHRNIVPRHSKRASVAPTTSSTEDSIFSLNAQQTLDARAAGLFEAFFDVVKGEAVSSGFGVGTELELLVRREIEEEIVRLEWRAFRESEKTAIALQRMLLLTTAVPFLEETKKNSTEHFSQKFQEWQRIIYHLWVKWRCKTFASAGSVTCEGDTPPWGVSLLPGAFLSSSAKEYFVYPQNNRGAVIKTGRSRERRIGDGDEQNLLSFASSRRRGAYGYLSWRVDLYEPLLRASPSGNHGDYYVVGSSGRLLNATEVNKLIYEKLPATLADVVLDERVNSINALALTDIRKDVETWIQWLLHV